MPLRKFRHLPIRRKLRGITMIAAGAALFLACGSFVAYEMVTFPGVLVQRVSTEAEIIARQSASPLVFKDPDSARATLDALSAEPHVVTAAIYAADGALFASYVRSGASGPPPRPTPGLSPGHVFKSGRLILVRPVEFDKGVIGSVLIESDLTATTARLQRYALIALGVLALSMLLAHWTASRLQQVITGPIQHLAETATTVSIRRDYSVRAVVQNQDELGQLVDAFNHMLGEIQERDLALHDSEEKYRVLFESNPNPMWVYDPASLAFLAVNQAAVQLYGYSRDEFLGMTLKDIRPPEDVPALMERLQEPALAAIGSISNWRHCRKDGSVLDVEIASSAIVFGGRPGRLVMATDVSEKQRLEAQLLQSQKMEALGRLAGGVAHDFNNLLGVITGYSELLRRNLTPEDPGQKRVAEIQKAAERAASLTRQLLAFSRQEVIRPKVLDLNELVVSVETMLRRLIGEDVQLTTKLERNLGRVRADRGQLDQILLNLAVNARDAMPEGGNLWIETSNASLDEAYLRTHADVRPGPYVLLAVSDTGHGMDESTVARVFEPFFTTKMQGKGTGLGLATVFGIAKQSGGHVSVYSEPGRGSTFRVYLPRVDAAMAEAEAEAGAPPQRGVETVLLVEDAEALRTMIHEILEAAGYRVIESSNPQEALARVGTHEGPLDLILTDVIMPHMKGPELVKLLHVTRPGVKVLFMSGYTNEAIGKHGVIEPGVHFLQKPFTSTTLLGSVRAALNQGELQA